MSLPGYERFPGSGRRYADKATGEIISYDKYLSKSRDGMNSHQYQKFTHTANNRTLAAAYKEKNGSLAGIRLAIANLKDVPKGKSKRHALAVFYTIGPDVDDALYTD